MILTLLVFTSRLERGVGRLTWGEDRCASEPREKKAVKQRLFLSALPSFPALLLSSPLDFIAFPIILLIQILSRDLSVDRRLKTGLKVLDASSAVPFAFRAIHRDFGPSQLSGGPQEVSSSASAEEVTLRTASTPSPSPPPLPPRAVR